MSGPDTDPCTCGHAPEEHGDDPAFPGGSVCNVADCDCIAYEADADAFEGGDDDDDWDDDDE